MTEFLINGPHSADCTVILAHGAGAGMDSPFMEFIACALAERELRVVRFEFPYMQRRREDGSKRPPDRAPVLQSSWLAVVQRFQTAGRLVLGGKSMGGRWASMIADEVEAAGLVCLGYPFHPLGKPDQRRIDHLQQLKTPALFLQGERDRFGDKSEVEGYNLARQIRFHWLGDGDHSFKPRKASGRTQEQNWDEAVTAIAQFVEIVSV